MKRTDESQAKDLDLNDADIMDLGAASEQTQGYPGVSGENDPILPQA